jgi:N-methylhydantoinase B
VEVIGSAMMSIVEEMGEALVRASHSANIKERRDCSTALFDAHGRALCQADHIPMHLGSFLGIIPHIMKAYPAGEIHEGDIFVANDAYEGGATSPRHRGGRARLRRWRAAVLGGQHRASR